MRGMRARRTSFRFIPDSEHLLPERITPSDVGGAAEVAIADYPDLPDNPFAPDPDAPSPPKLIIFPDGSYLVPGSKFIHARPLDGVSYPYPDPNPYPTPIAPAAPPFTPTITGPFIQGTLRAD